MERNSRPLPRHSEWEVLSADFADDAEGRKICAISVICGLYFIPNSAFVLSPLYLPFSRIQFGMDGWEKSGGGLPQSKTGRKFGTAPANAKRLGVRQPSGALECGDGRLERELSQLAARGRWLTFGIAGRLVSADVLRLGTSRAPANPNERWQPA